MSYFSAKDSSNVAWRQLKTTWEGLFEKENFFAGIIL